MKKEKAWFFNIVEEAILNQDFEKKHPNFAAGRIEIWHKDCPFDIEEIRLLLPREIFNQIRDALDFKEVDHFQIANVYSDQLLKQVKRICKKNWFNMKNRQKYGRRN